MSNFKYKFQMYKHLQAKTPEIYAEARKAADDLGIASIRVRKGLQRHLRPFAHAEKCGEGHNGWRAPLHP